MNEESSIHQLLTFRNCVNLNFQFLHAALTCLNATLYRFYTSFHSKLYDLALCLVPWYFYASLSQFCISLQLSKLVLPVYYFVLSPFKRYLRFNCTNMPKAQPIAIVHH